MAAFATQTGDGSSTGVFFSGGVVTFYATGTWDGATCTAQVSFDGGTTYFASGSETTLTADGAGNIVTGPCFIRSTVSGAGTTSITAGLSLLPREGA